MKIGRQLTEKSAKNMRSWLITFNVTLGIVMVERVKSRCSTHQTRDIEPMLGSMLARRLRRRPTIDPTLVQCIVSAVLYVFSHIWGIDVDMQTILADISRFLIIVFIFPDFLWTRIALVRCIPFLNLLIPVKPRFLWRLKQTYNIYFLASSSSDFF